MVSAREKGKVLFDYLQKRQRQNHLRALLLRAHPGAPWPRRSSGKKLCPTEPTISYRQCFATVLPRWGDLFAGVLSKPQELGPAIEKLSGVMDIRCSTTRAQHIADM